MAQEDLDRKAKLVLEAVYELGGEADTSEVKEYTGIDSNGVVHYRYDKLEEVGLIETRTVNRGDTLDVTLASLTDRGHDRVGDILENGEGPTVVEQVEELKTLVRDLHDDVRHFEGRLDAVEDRVGEANKTANKVNRRFEDAEDLKSLRSEVEEDLDGLRKEMEDWVSDFEKDVEKRIDAMDEVRKVNKTSEVLEKVGLIQKRHGTWRPGPTSADFRNLWRYGVLSSLVDATTPKSGAYQIPGEGAPEDIDWEDLPVDEQEVPEWG